jgi:hypothetical protein
MVIKFQFFEFIKTSIIPFAFVCSFLGGSLIICYYFSLQVRFMPTVSFSQIGTMVYSAFFLGFILLLAIFLVSVAPACTYRLFDLDVDKLDERGAWYFFWRSFVTQVAGMGFLFVRAFWTHNSEITSNIVVIISGNILIFCVLGSFFFPRLSLNGKVEGRLKFCMVNFYSALLSIVTISMLAGLFSSVPEKNRAASWIFFLTCFVVALVSSGISIIKTKNFKILGVFFAPYVFLIMTTFNILPTFLKIIVQSIDIAEKGAVTIILPVSGTNAVCDSVKNALTYPDKLVCQCGADEIDGFMTGKAKMPQNIAQRACNSNRGVLKDVLLLSSLGDRWLLQETETSSPIVFDGKGVVIKKAVVKEK